MLVRFNDRVFLQEGQWFLWDSSLELFRPIDGYSWNGTSYEVKDQAYCADPLSRLYCFGSQKLRSKCVELTNKYKHNIDTAPRASYLAIGTPVWFRDRPVSFSPCASKDVASWKLLVNGRARTCKQRLNKRFTRRNLK